MWQKAVSPTRHPQSDHGPHSAIEHMQKLLLLIFGSQLWDLLWLSLLGVIVMLTPRWLDELHRPLEMPPNSSAIAADLHRLQQGLVAIARPQGGGLEGMISSGYVSKASMARAEELRAPLLLALVLLAATTAIPLLAAIELQRLVRPRIWRGTAMMHGEEFGFVFQLALRIAKRNKSSQDEPDDLRSAARDATAATWRDWVRNVLRRFPLRTVLRCMMLTTFLLLACAVSVFALIALVLMLLEKGDNRAVSLHLVLLTVSVAMLVGATGRALWRDSRHADQYQTITFENEKAAHNARVRAMQPPPGQKRQLFSRRVVNKKKTKEQLFMEATKVELRDPRAKHDAAALPVARRPSVEPQLEIEDLENEVDGSDIADGSGSHASKALDDNVEKQKEDGQENMPHTGSDSEEPLPPQQQEQQQQQQQEQQQQLKSENNKQKLNDASSTQPVVCCRCHMPDGIVLVNVVQAWFLVLFPLTVFARLQWGELLRRPPSFDARSAKDAAQSAGARLAAGLASGLSTAASTAWTTVISDYGDTRGQSVLVPPAPTRSGSSIATLQPALLLLLCSVTMLACNLIPTTNLLRFHFPTHRFVAANGVSRCRMRVQSFCLATLFLLPSVATVAATIFCLKLAVADAGAGVGPWRSMWISLLVAAVAAALSNLMHQQPWRVLLVVAFASPTLAFVVKCSHRQGAQCFRAEPPLVWDALPDDGMFCSHVFAC